MRAALHLLLVSFCAPGAALGKAPTRADFAETASPAALAARLFREIAGTLHPLGDNWQTLQADVPALYFVSDGRPSAEPGLCEADKVVVDLQPGSTAARLRVKRLSAHPVYYAPSPARLIEQPMRGLNKQEEEAEAAICGSADPRTHNLLTAPSAYLAVRSIREVAHIVEAVRDGKPPENLLCGSFPEDPLSDSRSSCLQAISAIGSVDLIHIDACPDTPPGACLIASNQDVAMRFDLPDANSSPRRIRVEPVTDGIMVT